MSTEARPEIPIENARALVEHLKDRRSRLIESPQDLAKRFDLSAEFVASVLAEAEKSGHRDAPHFPQFSWKRVKDKLGLLLKLIDRAADKPSAFVFVSTLWAVAFFTPISYFYSEFNVSAAISLVLAVGMSHGVIYFRKAMTRYALYGALIVWLTVSLPLMLITWLRSMRDPEPERAGLSLVVAAAVFLVACAYAAVGSLCSVLGGYVRLVSNERREEQMSRHEVLDRYFELQERLERAVSLEREHTWEDWPPVREIKRHVFVSALLAGVALFEAQSLILASAAVPGVVVVTIKVALLLLQVAAFVLVAFLAGGIRPALGAAILFLLGGLASQVFPTTQVDLTTWSHPTVYLDVVAMLGLAAIVGLGSTIQRQAIRQLHLQRNDHAALVAEMLRIQWRLSDETTYTCVMVVDVAKSGEMKAAADPLKVEYSFRQYQKWVADTTALNGGRVHSTAGDGAVVAFSGCLDAFESARRIQSGIESFNRTKNRLESPFRLRVGLHVGQVQGDLGKVQFTEVIDIAAHVQGLSPVSGIAVTDDVVRELNESDFVPLARHIDGHAVYLALDPVGF